MPADHGQALMWETDPATLTAFGTWALVVGTLVLMYWQTRQTRLLNSATSVMLLRERFDAGAMRRARKQLAGRLLRNEHEDITHLDVGAFFELVGALTHRKVLDLDLIWEAFGGWISAYYWGLRHPIDIIARGRGSFRDPLIFHEFEWLEQRIAEVDRGRTGIRERPTPAEEEQVARQLLQRESELELID